jgi:uncharacterized membrane protein
VPTLFRHRKLIAIVCVAAILVTAMTPATWGLLCGVLVLLDPLFGIVISEPAALADQLTPPPFPFLETFESRGPPPTL